jgi:pantoate--beta-alanine ligase
MPGVDTMYPFGADGAVRIRVPGVTDVLEGAHRPGHFDGVATVVARLFLQVQPDVAAFGRKDFQQLAVIRYMARDLAFPSNCWRAETLAEPDGLAMSSRNQYLSPEERPRATLIHRTLQAMRAATQDGGPARQWKRRRWRPCGRRASTSITPSSARPISPSPATHPGRGWR